MKRLLLILFLFLIAGVAALASKTGDASAASPTLATATPTPAVEVRPELEKFFQGHKGAFVLYDRNRNRILRYNPERCAERFLPASTFKILNSLIGLETGVIPDENYVIRWDGAQYPIPAWNQDHTLKTAIQNSVVWYYQELARRVGKEKMQRAVTAAGYGNGDISGKIDSFWLDGGLRISADEQVAFLRRFYNGNLPFSTRALNIVKRMIMLDKTDAYSLSGKTGSVVRVKTYQGWFVGYVETKGNVYTFATNLESTSPDGLANGALAQKISLEMLRSLDVLP